MSINAFVFFKVRWDPHFTPRVTERELSPGVDRLREVVSVDPLYSFNGSDFTRRHMIGTQKEFLLEKISIDAFNRKEHKFRAWPIFYICQNLDSAVMLFLVEPSDHDSMLPKEGEKCDIIIPGFEKSPATRADNPCSLWKVRNELWEKCLAFHVHLKGKEKIMGAFPNLKLVGGKMKIPSTLRLQVRQATFELRVSTSTRDAELGALHSLEQGRKGEWNGLSQWQIDAYKYFVLLESPTGYMRLFSRFPHMMDPFLKPELTSPRLVKLVQDLNYQQKSAFQNILQDIPNGICNIHGCPGAGKTHFNLVVAAALQSKDEIELAGSQSPVPWDNKVLYLIDINRPLNDAANKMARLYNELGLTKKSRIDGSVVLRVVIRMHCWSYEKTAASRKRLQAEWEELNHRMQQSENPEGPRQGSNAQQNENNAAALTDGSNIGPLQRYNAEIDESQELPIHEFAHAFRNAEHSFRARAHQTEEYIAPSLDEAAWEMYERFKDTKYARLHTIRRQMDLGRSTDLGHLENAELEIVYRDTLLDADAVFTTPVSASKFSSSMFSPALVIFDEAPHARELSTLIALAKFNPAAWIFSGDVRQTKPFVGSLGNIPCKNEHARQLQVSMMARAQRAYPNAPSLNINHRALGNLQQLASTLFYSNKMIPAIDPEQPGGVPPSTAYLRNRYIMPMKRDAGNQVSRLLVSLKDPGPARQPDDRSWWHPGHQRWVMDLVLKLLKDGRFRQTNGTDQGTILIMTPYKEASNQYRKAIRELKSRHQSFRDRIVEARTIDTAQGHEADAVILDFVRQKPTKHLEDQNRLCVALTRARQIEVILMHQDLIRAVEFINCNLRSIVSICKRSGEYISDPEELMEPPREIVTVDRATAENALGFGRLSLGRYLDNFISQ